MERLPKSWNDVTVGAFLSAKEEESRGGDVLAVRCGIINAISGVEVVTTRSKLDDVYEAWERVGFFRNVPKTYRRRAADRVFIGFETLSLAELIELEHLFESGYYLNLGKILALLYRRYRLGEFGEMVLMSFEAMDIQEEADECEGLNAADVLGVVSAYLSYRDRVQKSKPSVFGRKDQEEAAEEPEEQDEEEAQDEKIARVWGWELLIYEAVKGDITKIPDLLRQNALIVLTFIEMKRELKLQ